MSISMIQYNFDCYMFKHVCVTEKPIWSWWIIIFFVYSHFQFVSIVLRNFAPVFIKDIGLYFFVVSLLILILESYSLHRRKLGLFFLLLFFFISLNNLKGLFIDLLWNTVEFCCESIFKWLFIFCQKGFLCYFFIILWLLQSFYHLFFNVPWPLGTSIVS